MFVRSLLKKKNMLLFEIVRNFDYLKVGKYDFSLKNFVSCCWKLFLKVCAGKIASYFFVNVKFILYHLIRPGRKGQVPIPF